MSAVEASSVSVRSMADGTLRVSVDVEPRHSQAAYALFMPPGVQMALAALSPTALAPAPPPAKGGELSKWVAMRCDDFEFAKFVRVQATSHFGPSELCAVLVRALCEVDSRAEIDNDPAARERFESRIRGPWVKRQQECAP